MPVKNKELIDEKDDDAICFLREVKNMRRR